MCLASDSTVDEEDNMTVLLMMWSDGQGCFSPYGGPVLH